METWRNPNTKDVRAHFCASFPRVSCKTQSSKRCVHYWQSTCTLNDIPLRNRIRSMAFLSRLLHLTTADLTSTHSHSTALTHKCSSKRLFQIPTFPVSAWTYKCTIFQLLHLRYISPIRSLKKQEHLKDILLKPCSEIWGKKKKKVSQRFRVLSFFMVPMWHCLQMTTAYPKPMWKRDLSLIFRTIFVMSLWWRYGDFSMSILFNLLHWRFPVSFCKLGGVKRMFCSFVCSTENHIKMYPLHVPEKAGIML